MVYVSGIRSSIHGRISRVAFLFTIVIGVTGSFAALADEATKTPTPQSQGADCAKPRTSTDPFFRDLKGVHFYLQIPERLEQAAKCHGDEIPCSRGDPDYRKQLIADYNTYPFALHPENLTDIFVKQIQKSILPFVQKDEHCQVPEIQILTKKTLNLVSQPGTLTVTVKLMLDVDYDRKTAKPFLEYLMPDVALTRRIAAISVDLFRPESQYLDYYRQVLENGVTNAGAVIPLAVPPSEIEARLKYLLDRSPAFMVGTYNNNLIVDDFLVGGHRHEIPKK